VRRYRDRSFPRTKAALAIAVLNVVTCVAAIGIVLSPAPRGDKFVQAAAISPAPTTIGISDADVYGMSPADADRTMAVMQTTGVKTVRLLIPWGFVEYLPGQYYWTDVDKIVNAAVAHGLSILGVIHSTPTWALAIGGLPTSGPPQNPASYGNFAAQVATRYKGRISAYEIWNEPNAALFWSPAPYPAGYTSLLKAAYPKIKAIDPSVPVIAAGLGAIIDWLNVAINPVKFVQQMYAAGAKPYFDALAYHPYQYTLKFSDGVPVANSPVNQLMQMRQVMIANGDASKKIWATEYGEPTSQTDQAGQVAFISDMYTKWQEMPYTGPLLIYTTRDRNSASTQADDTFGIVKQDWTPKQSQQALQFAIPAGPPKSPEFQRFSMVTDPAHGTVMSPVFRATPTVWAQFRTVNAIFETTSGFIASPMPVAQLAMMAQGVPYTPFTNGWQDFHGTFDFRIWWSQATGAHWAQAAFAQVWVPQLGLATSDQTNVNGGIRVNFEHGYMMWTAATGIKIYYT
jgi:polysaccharide biosynthesis protein PslG